MFRLWTVKMRLSRLNCLGAMVTALQALSLSGMVGGRAARLVGLPGCSLQHVRTD